MKPHEVEHHLTEIVLRSMYEDNMCDPGPRMAFKREGIDELLKLIDTHVRHEIQDFDEWREQNEYRLNTTEQRALCLEMLYLEYKAETFKTPTTCTNTEVNE